MESELNLYQERGELLQPRGRKIFVYITFFVLLWVIMFCNFDHGAIPAILNEFEQEIPISYTEKSLLGSFIYLGLIFGTPIAGILFQRRRAKWLLVLSQISLALSLIGLSQSDGLILIYLTRILSGFSQAFPITYLPVWIADVSTSSNLTRWMASNQLATILGTVLGYFIGGLLNIENIKPIGGLIFLESWRLIFLIQVVFILISILSLVILPNQLVDLPPPNQLLFDMFERSSSYSIETVAYGRLLQTSFRRAVRILKNKLYLTILIALCNLFFVFTGILFWATEYTVLVLHQPRSTVIKVSAILYLLSPTIGVWIGGWICDFFGGYQGNQVKAIRIATCLAGAASFFALLCIYIKDYIFFSTSLFFCLLFGSSLVPICSSIALSCVNPMYRSISSAINQFSFNCFGWFASPLLSGVFMDIIAMYFGIETEAPLKYGVYAILSSSLIGFFALIIANFFV